MRDPESEAVTVPDNQSRVTLTLTELGDVVLHTVNRTAHPAARRHIPPQGRGGGGGSARVSTSMILLDRSC